MFQLLNWGSGFRECQRGGMLTGDSLGWQPSVGRTGSRQGPGIEKGAPLGGVEDFWSGRWEVRF